MKIVDLPESRHNSIRDTATMNYMGEAKRRRVRHESEPSFIGETYSIGDTVGIKPGIHDTSFASKSPFKKTWIKKT